MCVIHTSNVIDKMLKTCEFEDAKLLIATLESFQTGTLTPLLKEELRYRIQSRRLSEGKEELSVETCEINKPPQELRPDEIERKLRRKDQNRRAAARFRNKRKGQTVNMQELCGQLESRNKDLREEIKNLKHKRDMLRSELTKILEEVRRTANV